MNSLVLTSCIPHSKVCNGRQPHVREWRGLLLPNLCSSTPSQAQLINSCALMGPVFLTCKSAIGFGNVKEMMRDLSVSQFTASWARTPMRVWRIHLRWWMLHFGWGSVWRIQKLQKCGKRKIFLPHCRSSRLWHWRIDVHWWVLCEAVPVVWRPIRLRRWSRRMQISYGHWPMQRLHVSGRFSLSEMELSGWPTYELLRRKWRIQLRTASAQYRDDLSHPRIHVFTLSPMNVSWFLTAVMEFKSATTLRQIGLQPRTKHARLPSMIHSSTFTVKELFLISWTTVKLVPKSDNQPSQTRIRNW